jgi:hypothetical protein
MAKKRRKRSRKARLPRIVATRVLNTADIVDQAGVFAIMLDSLIRVHPQHFPITAQSRDLDELRRITQHAGQFVLIPRGTSSAQLLENKDLINTITGAVDDGAIYRVTVAQE